MIMKTTIDVLLKEKSYNVYCIHPEDSVYEGAVKMAAANIGALLVMDGPDILGIFTERDVLTKVIAKGYDPQQVAIADVMTHIVVCVSLDTTTEEAMSIMTDKRIRHLPVMDRGELVGLVSIGDVTKWLSTVHLRQTQEIDELIHYIHGGYSA